MNWYNKRQIKKFERIFDNIVEIGFDKTRKAYVVHLKNTEAVTRKQIKKLDKMGYDINELSIFSGGSIKIVLKHHNRLVITVILISSIVWLLLLV